MKTYFEAYRERLERNQADLFNLANEVLKQHPEIEIYHYRGDRFVQGLIFFNGENINSIHFHEVPYRWSGCGYDEINIAMSHRGGDNVSMPFTVEDVISTFKPVTSKNRDVKTKFKSKEDYLKWCSYLVKYNKEV